MSPAEARATGASALRLVSLAADECRDARGTAFVDDLARDILYAFRTFRRAPLTALTIVATVALGLGSGRRGVHGLQHFLLPRRRGAQSRRALRAWSAPRSPDARSGAVHAAALRGAAP